MKVRIQEIPKITKNFARPARTRVFHGGRGGGKTKALALRTALRVYQLAEMGVTGVFLCGREFMESLDDSSMAEVKEAIQSVDWLKDYFDIGETYIRTKNRRIKYVFRGLRHNIDSLKSLANIVGAWVDEAETVSERAWDKLEPTIRSEGDGWVAELWLSYNPESPESATHKRFRDDPAHDCVVTEINYYDNPFFPAILEAKRKEYQRKNPDTYDHVWGGKFLTLTDAQILNGKYTIQDFEPDHEWDGPYQGGDFGFSKDPAAAVRCWIGHDPYGNLGDNCLWVEYEAGKIGLELDAYADHTTSEIPDFEKHITRWDSAQPGMISHIRTHGLPHSIPCEKWAGSVEDGIEYLKSFDKIIIHTRCTQTAREARLYSYKVDRLSGDIMAVVVDKHNHWIDALRYALGPMIRKQIKEGWVLTRD